MKRRGGGFEGVKSESPSLAVIKQGTRRRAALRRQQRSWCDDRQARNGCAARSCDGVETVEKFRGVEFDAVSVASGPSCAGRGARQRSFNSRGCPTSASWLGGQLAVSAISRRWRPAGSWYRAWWLSRRKRPRGSQQNVATQLLVHTGRRRSERLRLATGPEGFRGHILGSRACKPSAGSSSGRPMAPQ